MHEAAKEIDLPQNEYRRPGELREELRDDGWAVTAVFCSVAVIIFWYLVSPLLVGII
jgi:hypothetical protein